MSAGNIYLLYETCEKAQAAKYYEPINFMKKEFQPNSTNMIFPGIIFDHADDAIIYATKIGNRFGV